MGCSSCGTSSAGISTTNYAVQRNSRIAEAAGPCDYNNEQLEIWASKLKWFKNKGLHVKHGYAPKIINKYLGIVLTSININNKCVYKETLDEMSSLIAFITSLQ